MLTLRDIMTPEVITVGPDTPLAEVAELLATHGISGVPVIGTSRVLGVVSNNDIMDFSARDVGDQAADGGGPVWDAIDENRDETPAAPFYYDPWLDRQVARDALDWDDEESPFGEFTAADIMTRRLCSLPSATPLAEAGRYMIERGIHRVLVIDDGTLIGIVTSMDFVRVAADGIAQPA